LLVKNNKGAAHPRSQRIQTVPPSTASRKRKFLLGAPKARLVPRGGHKPPDKTYGPETVVFVWTPYPTQDQPLS